MRNENDSKCTGRACFIVLQVAFDSLYHEILLEKLFNFCFRGPMHDMLADYLRNRCQFVSSHNDESCQLPINTSVSKGSILRQSLFLVYVDDLPAYCKHGNKIAMFAYDTSSVKSAEKNNLNLQNDLRK